jgi:hypothetical protein
MENFVIPFCDYCWRHLWSKNWTLRAPRQLTSNRLHGVISKMIVLIKFLHIHSPWKLQINFEDLFSFRIRSWANVLFLQPCENWYCSNYHIMVRIYNISSINAHVSLTWENNYLFTMMQSMTDLRPLAWRSQNLWLHIHFRLNRFLQKIWQPEE